MLLASGDVGDLRRDAETQISSQRPGALLRVGGQSEERNFGRALPAAFVNASNQLSLLAPIREDVTKVSMSQRLVGELA